MIKRSIDFGDYNTAAHGWTLSSWTLSGASPKTNYVDKSGGDGSWDLSTALTDGIVRYSDRNLSVTLETSEGDRLTREARIRDMINQLDGQRMDIFLPDDLNYHITGRLHVVRSYNDMAHGSVSVTATCEPWKYANSNTVVQLTAASTAKTADLVNNGRRSVVPVLTVTGSNASVTLTYGSQSAAFSSGTHKWPDLLLTPGSHSLTYQGTGTLAISYKEAVLE